VKYSTLFTKTRKDAPSDELAKNAQLLIRAGYVYKVMAGVYSYTPLGLAVLENIKQVVREEMDAIGVQELIMTALQRADTWQATGRWDDEVVDVWFKTQLKDKTEVGLAWSHEEAIIEMLKNHITSYKDLPVNVYQFQTKFRNELRSKSGIMRGREFVMKDAYSCSTNEAQHDAFYNSCIDAYMRAFRRLGIGDDTYVTYASGGAFTQFSHEFQTECDAGEDYIYLNRGKKVAINEEIFSDAVVLEMGLQKGDFEKVKTAEVGNIFNFGTQKSEETNFVYTNEAGEQRYIHLGSYGIGITRVMGVIVEKHADERGLVWSKELTPAQVHLCTLGGVEVETDGQKLYDTLASQGVRVLWDDRDVSAGEKFADADLIGCPIRVVISKKTVASGQYEIKYRASDKTEMHTLQELIKELEK
jgi:prolyl-tRNA synthetase